MQILNRLDFLQIGKTNCICHMQNLFIPDSLASLVSCGRRLCTSWRHPRAHRLRLPFLFSPSRSHDPAPLSSQLLSTPQKLEACPILQQDDLLDLCMERSALGLSIDLTNLADHGLRGISLNIPRVDQLSLCGEVSNDEMECWHEFPPRFSSSIARSWRAA